MDAVVREYLARLEAAAARLPTERRSELVSEVREHIEAAIGDGTASTEAKVRNVLDRLGTPEEIVAAEAPQPDDGWTRPAAIGPGGAIAAARPGIGFLEVAALLLATVGAFAVPIVGPAIGIALVWLSRAWSTRVKIVLTGLILVLLVLPIVAVLAAGVEGGVTEGSVVPAP